MLLRLTAPVNPKEEGNIITRIFSTQGLRSFAPLDSRGRLSPRVFWAAFEILTLRT